MKKPIKLVLFDEEEDPFNIVGICSSFNDYRMGWFLNNVMGWKLVQSQEELEIPIKKSKQLGSFSYFLFEHIPHQYQVYLIKNKQNGLIVAPDFPELDFLLVIHNNHEIDLDDFIHELRTQNGIIAAYIYTSNNFSSSEYLQFN